MQASLIQNEDTIVAISSGLVTAGIGIIRISGPAAIIVMQNLFKEAPREVRERYAYYGHVQDSEQNIIDDAIFIFMKGPRSFTGEDMLEIQGHGSKQGLRQIVEAVLKVNHSIREAEPGEFTKRAFMNGKMDLLQAEAVIDYINASTQVALEVALKQREGRLSKKIKRLRDELKEMIAEILAQLDYPEETEELLQATPYIQRLENFVSRIRELYETRHIGKVVREGIKLAIVGRPNVGKSTLFNALLGEERAIISEVPGTTRDIISENLNISGYNFAISDTAGIRETDNTIEQRGIAKSMESLEEADIALVLLDSSQKISTKDREIFQLVKNSAWNSNKKQYIIIVLNKTDLGDVVDEEQILAEFPDSKLLKISLKEDEINKALAKISEELLRIERDIIMTDSDCDILTNSRQVRTIEEILELSEEVYSNALQGQELDFVEMDLRKIYQLLGTLIGEDSGEEIIEEVFNKFCLGK